MHWLFYWLFLGCLTSALALALLYLACNTQAGIAMVDRVPAWLWNGVCAALGLNHRDGESAEDAVAIVVLLLCAVIAASAVGITYAILTRAGSAKRRNVSNC